LPPTIAFSTPRCRRDVACAWARTPGHGPGARHATRKLMAPPLRFFVLPAFLSLGDRRVPACLTDTIRSQGFSPSQRFHPTRALRLCFASHPPIGFPAFRAFPTQPAVAPLDAPCSSVVTSSSGFKGSPPFFHRPSFPSLDDRCSNVVPCYEPVVPLSARRNITFSSIGRSRTARRERSRRLPRVNAQRLIARFSGVTTVNRSNFRLAWDANSRALLRLSVRTRSNAVKRTIEPMLS
jgi:hypothetical protein